MPNALRLARLHASAGDHRQALHLVMPATARPLDPHARLLAAQSLFELAHYEACLALLGDEDYPEEAVAHLANPSAPEPCRQLVAALSVLRARVHERQDNPSRAIVWYKRALRADIFCLDAFDRIVNATLIAPDDARVFISDLTSSHLLDPSDKTVTWLCAYYRAAADPSAPLPPSPPALLTSLEVRHLIARRAFDALDFTKCEAIIREMLHNNPHIPHHVLVTYLAALVELDDRQQLFDTAHRLVDDDPKAAVPWLAVAYYYFASGKPDLSRRFLRKATSIDARLAPAWVALGHAFAAQDESDQAMAAYRTASRLFPGAQLPPLFMGMEYARQGSLMHATILFQTALSACNSDPAPRHELGVVAYRMGDTLRAAAYFKEALSLWEASNGVNEFSSVAGRRADAEEATLVNLGHCYRRQSEFLLAKRCYERALKLRPRSPSTCTALGMTFHSMGDLAASVTMYHRSLRDNPADAVCNELLERALWDSFNSDQTDWGQDSVDDDTDMPVRTDTQPAIPSHVTIEGG